MSLPSLLHGLFDHAGLFPPESLSFSEAMARAGKLHAQLQHPEIMAAQMVVSYDNLASINHELLQSEGFTQDRPCKVCVVGVQADQIAELAPSVARWVDAARGLAELASVEVVLAPESDSPELAASLAALPLQTRLFLELADTTEHWLGGNSASRMAVALRENDLDVGLKARCAGPNQLSPDALAHLFAFAVEHDLPVKLTQGLHHLLSDANGAYFGYLNVALAFRLAELGANESEIQELLQESSLDRINMDEDCFEYNGEILTGDGLDFSIGSCSLHEPDEELGALA